MKKGLEWDLLSDLASQEEMMLSSEEIKGILDPKLYTGRCASQVESLVAKLKPLTAFADNDVASIDL